MSDTKKFVEKLKDKRKTYQPSHSDSGSGLDGFNDRTGKGSDNGEAPALETKPSGSPIRKVKPRDDGK